ncbi:MAG: Peptidase Ste24p [Pedosphaera sp.]|nr:Peptidase Ste24p [Pedosphaera sp.]
MESETQDPSIAPEAATVTGSSPLQFVEGPLQRPKISFLYQFSLVVVSLAMILLPLLYFALVAFFGYGVYYYAAHFHTFMAGPGYGPRMTFVMIMANVGAISIGVVLTFFLVKPIFAPKSEADEPFCLNHADAPQLFALIGWVCRSLQAPIPSRIDVDLRANAAAGFRSGLRSLFGNDIILVIGLPLVAGMNLSQFAGVIAHEYGHFSQGTAMRAGYLIDSINRWFARVVYERDGWDDLLVAVSEHEQDNVFVVFIAFFARLGVWFGRGVLWVFMLAGIALSGFLSRQMEFDADGYQIRMSGSDTFVASMRRLRQLNLGVQVAEKQVRAKWKKDQKLFDQIPDFIVSRADEVSAETQDRHHTMVSEQKTGLFDTHPSDTERSQRAIEAKEPGIFHATAPATSLFANFSELSRRVTIVQYRSMFGPGFSTDWLISTEQAARQAEHDYVADKETVKRYFLGITTSLRPIILPEARMPILRSRETLIEEMRTFGQRMKEMLPATGEAYNAFKDADERLLQASEASYLLQAGFAFNPADFGVADTEINNEVEKAREAFHAAGAGLEAFEEAGKARLTAAIQLLGLPLMATPIPNAAQFQEEARQMIWTLARLGDAFGLLLEIRRDCDALETLLRFRAEGQRAENLTATLASLGMGIEKRVDQVQQKMAQTRYPFQHTTEQVLVNDYARNKEYHPDPFELVLREGQSHTEKLIALYYRLLSHLILIAEQVERSLTPT